MSEHQFNLQRDPLDERDFKLSAILQPVQKIKIPRQVDLRKKCPIVFNQLDLGSCTGQAGVGAKMVLDNKPNEILSALYLYYMERSLEGTIDQDAGANMRSICSVLLKSGVCLEELMPYKTGAFRVSPSEAAVIDASNRKITAYRTIAGIKQTKECLALRQQAVLVGMEVYQSFENIGCQGKLKMPSTEEKYLGGHAVLIVGYVDSPLSFLFPGRGYFIVRNSWGSAWGDKGYFYMPYEYITNGHAWDFWTIE